MTTYNINGRDIEIDEGAEGRYKAALEEIIDIWHGVSQSCAPGGCTCVENEMRRIARAAIAP